jgi:poly-gamma-glutamate synthesis protein (capsule biosynthesis protein)
MVFCGDIMLGAEVGKHMMNATVADWLAGISMTWRTTDLLIGNLESPCVQDAKPAEGPGDTRAFHAPIGRLVELAEAGFSAVTLANNHVLDCGSHGLSEMLRGLDQAGIAHAGAGMNLAEALQPAFIAVGGLTVALVAFCYGPPAGPSRPGVAPYEPKLMRKALTAARQGADFVIAALHDGLEYSDVPPARTRARFRFLAENGADVVIGHHPHVLQGLEWCGRVPIAYSLGNLLFDSSLPHITERSLARMAIGRYAPEEVQRDPGKFGRGAVLTVHVAGGETSIQWHPFRQDPKLRPQLSSGGIRAEDLRRLDDLSAALLNGKDPRHALAESVFQAAWWESRDDLGVRQLCKLALRPRWRYVPRGLRWLWRRLQRG